MSTQNRQKIFDALCEMKDAGLVAASAAAQVDSADKVFDTGGGWTEGTLVVNVTAAEVDTGDELYTIKLQGTNTAAFGGTDIVDLVTMPLGDAAVLVGDADLGAGRYIMPFYNMLDDTIYQYLRLYTVVAGTIASGINYTAFLSK